MLRSALLESNLWPPGLPRHYLASVRARTSRNNSGLCCSCMHTKIEKHSAAIDLRPSPQLFSFFCFGNTAIRQYDSTTALKKQTVEEGVPVAKYDVPTTSPCSGTGFSLSHGSVARKRLMRFKGEGRTCLFGKGSMVDPAAPTTNMTRHGESTIMCKAGRQEGVS